MIYAALKPSRRSHSSRNVFSRQANSSLEPSAKRPLGSGVRQDKARNQPIRAASRQAAPLPKGSRAHVLNSNSHPSQKGTTPQRRTVQITLWVKPIVKEELQKITKRDGISISSVGAALLEKAVQQNIDMQYGALLRPVIESAIRYHMRGISTRLALLLVRTAFETSQTRTLVTNILARQQGMTKEDLTKLLEFSSKKAKFDLLKRTPEITELIEAVERWLAEIAEGEEERSKREG